MSKKTSITTQCSIIVLFIVLSLINVPILKYHGETIIRTLNDAPFHFSRMLSLANIFESPVNFTYFNQAGVPTALFYPSLLLYPMYLLYQLTHQLMTSYYLFFIILTFITLYIGYYVVRQMGHDTKTALLFTVIYTFATYRTNNIYNRHAIGEVIAYTFFPLVLLGIYQIFYQKEKRWLTLTIAMTVLAYSHVLSLLMATLFVGGVLLVRWCRSALSFVSIKALAKSAITSLLLSMGALLPIFYYQSGTTIRMPDEHFIQQTATTLWKLLERACNNRIGIGASATMGLVILIAIAFATYRMLTHTLNTFQKDIYWLGCLFLIMTTPFFPWAKLQHTFLASIQFPWRFLALAILCFAYLGTVAFIDISTQPKRLVIVLIALISLLHCSTIQTFWNEAIQEDATTSSKAPVTIATDQSMLHRIRHNRTKDVGRWDYSPARANKYHQLFKAHRVLVNKKPVESTRHVKASTITFTVKAKKGDAIILPVYRYLGQQVQINHKTVKTITAYTGGTQVIATHAINHIHISYHYPRAIVLAFSCSIICLLLLCIYKVIIGMRQ